MTNGNEGTKSGCPRWMKGGLVASVALNLLIVGVFVGYLIQNQNRPRGHERLVGMIVEPLPAERRDMARDLMMKRHDEYRAVREQMYAAHMQVVEAMVQEPLNTEGLKAALDARAMLSTERRNLFSEQFVVLMTQLTREERTLIAAHFRKWAERRTKRRQSD